MKQKLLFLFACAVGIITLTACTSTPTENTTTVTEPPANGQTSQITEIQSTELQDTILRVDQRLQEIDGGTGSVK